MGSGLKLTLALTSDLIILVRGAHATPRCTRRHGGHLDIVQAPDAVRAQVKDLEASARAQLGWQAAQLVVTQP